ncbi:MAG: 2-oxoglutarate dehydrogenase E1 component [Anaerolineales bacterium]|jgi:2-oxoglutarate dehydrogenase E1 component
MVNKILSQFYGPNAGYVLELYEKYREDPSSVDSQTRAIFESWPPLTQIDIAPVSTAEALATDKITAAANLAQAIRSFGQLSAQLDPLGSSPPGDPWHSLSFYDLTEDDLHQLPAEVIGGPVVQNASSAYDALEELRAIYMDRIGYDYGHIQLPEERDWLRQAAENGSFRPPKNPVNETELLDRLSQVEAFEQFLHRTFPGKTRFSIEGLDILVPMLDELVGFSVGAGICSVLIGMAHRGRLNVLAHVLGKPYANILAEFKDPVSHFPTRDELGWSGDVKYHKGARRALKGGEEVKLIITMPPNPSHVEYIDPVLVGMARAAGSKVDNPGSPEFFPNASLPVMIHGDASFNGQGVVAETLNFSRLDGYTVGGTIHIIANNQLGYTTVPGEGRSTLYASDLAKGYEIPIIHVNADDPVRCLEAMRTAFAYRQKFHKDFLVDLVGYRRYGHNEGDEPSFTQPLMYKMIENHPSVRQIWADHLKKMGKISQDEAKGLVQKYFDGLQEVFTQLKPEEEIDEPLIKPPPHGIARQVDTSVPLEQLKAIHQNLYQVPKAFTLYNKIERSLRRRADIFDDPQQPSIDWSTAEQLALGTILSEGIAVRFSGEDAQRGTFSQRHAVFHDFETGGEYIPLQGLKQARASFEILNSPLSENGALGFEFGYNIWAPNRLVIWEAQYGDFVNTAQAMIDEFIVSARAKWEQTPSLVILLPHGDEGQGPDHSSGRPERFLELAADINIRVANCTTAAQYFHLLRRQALLLESDPLPLIVLTPKSLLRHPLVSSSASALSQGHWQPVIDDLEKSKNPKGVSRLLLCSGKIFIDLVTSDLRKEHDEVAIVRVEQLYPFPATDLVELFNRYPDLKQIIWMQEEPQNMGAWKFVHPILEKAIEGKFNLSYVGKPPSASPAEGSSAWHSRQQTALLQRAFSSEPELIKEA